MGQAGWDLCSQNGRHSDHSHVPGTVGWEDVWGWEGPPGCIAVICGVHFGQLFEGLFCASSEF